MKTLGERLKDLRKEKGYTLEQVAEKLNTTKITISRYENNLREPKRDVIYLLMKLFCLMVNQCVKKPLKAYLQLWRLAYH